MEARRGIENHWGREPVIGSVTNQTAGGRSPAGIVAKAIPFRIENVERGFSFGGGLQRVIENGAIGRILGSGKFRRERSLLVIVPANAHGGVWLREMNLHGRVFCLELK